MVPLLYYLIFSAALFSIGLFGVLARRNAIAILMGVELMLNAVTVNLVALWRYQWTLATSYQEFIAGQVWAVIVIAVAAAEVAVGLAIFISVYRRRKTVVAEDIDLLKW
jgi:NADH:ubiquinone oxidoreductase subunit K